MYRIYEKRGSRDSANHHFQSVSIKFLRSMQCRYYKRDRLKRNGVCHKRNFALPKKKLIQLGVRAFSTLSHRVRILYSEVLEIQAKKRSIPIQSTQELRKCGKNIRLYFTRISVVLILYGCKLQRASYRKTRAGDKKIVVVFV